MRKEVQVGIIALVTAAMVFVGLNYLGGSQYFGPPMVLYANYPKIDGLYEGNQVYIKGVSVGRVSDIDLLMEEGFIDGYTRIRLELDKKYKIPDNSEAMVFNVDLLGAKGIEIRVPPETEPSGNYLNSKQDITGSIDRGILGDATDLVLDEGARILVRLGELTLQLNKIIKSTQGLISDEQYTRPVLATLENIEATSSNLASISLKADSISSELNAMSGDAKSIVNNVKGNEDRINEILANIKTTTDSLADASSSIKQLMTDASSAVASVENVAVKLDTTTGTVGLLLNDRQLYDSLVSTTANLNVLLREAEENPQRFVDDIKLYLFERKKNKDNK